MNRKADFSQNESIRIDSHNESNRIDSNRELECSTTDHDERPELADDLALADGRAVVVDDPV